MADDDEIDAFARNSDPDTAQDAAARTRRNRKLEDKVIMCLRAKMVPMTVIEIAEELGIDKWSISPRMKPLEGRGYVVRSKKQGLNSNGKVRTLQAWKATMPKPLQLSFW